MLRPGAAVLLTLLGSCAPEPERVARIALVDLIDRAVVADEIGGDSTEGAGAVRMPSEGDLFLPAGTKTSLAIFPPDAPELRIDGVVARGGTRVEVEIETDAGTFATEVLGSAGNRTLRVELPNGQPTRLAFSVNGGANTEGRPSTEDSSSTDGTSNGGGRHGVVLRNPVIWGAPEEPSGSPTEPPSSAASRAAPPPVVIYLIDTLRRDRLGCYGYHKPVTPEIDAFAARATLFEDAVGQSSWTKASVASALTGVWPPAHGAVSWADRLPDRFDTLAEILERAGYATAGFSTNPNIIPKMGFDQGFQEFRHLGRIRSAALHDQVLEWLDGAPADRPILLYVQPIDPHSAYNPPQEFLDRHAPGVDPFGWQRRPKWKWPAEALPTLVSLYDAEIAATDDSFGRLLDELEDRGLYDSALIVLTSDHGEEFREHGGWRHGNHLYGETLEVPLIIKFPGQVEGLRVAGLAQHIDILPTILDVVGLPSPEGVEGTSLTGGDAALAGRRAYSHLRQGSKPTHLSVIDGEWKLMQRRRAEATDVFLFDLSDDPGEQKDVAAEFPVRTAAMLALLEAHFDAAQGQGEAETVEIDAELERELRALGYLQ